MLSIPTRTILFTSCLILFFFGCQKERSYHRDATTGQVVLPSPLKANLQGNVVDEQNQPTAGVTITVGSATVLTDAKGYFRIDKASLDQNASLVIAEKNGYFKTYRTFSATSGTNQLFLKLIRKIQAGTVSATIGGEVGLNNGTKISLPAGGIVRAADNTLYSGAVQVHAAYIDPTSEDISDRVPGSFMANDQAGKRVLLSSYGMMAVELESTSGEKLQIKSGSTATLTFPIPSAALASAPPTIPFWFVDEATGLWKEDGSATRQGSTYVGTVKHFTYWNCDVPVQTVKLMATFQTADGRPLVNAVVEIKPKTGDYFGSAHGFTDSLGQINGPVPANLPLRLKVMDACGNTAFTKDIGPYTESVDIGTISLPAATPGVVTVRGKLMTCSGAAVTNGYAIVSISNQVHYAKADGNGNFSTTYVLCTTTNQNAQVIGVDAAAQQQGNLATQPVALPTTDLGTIAACGTVSTESISFTIDGTNYVVASPDTLMANSSDSATTGGITYIAGIKMPKLIKLEINTTAKTAGSYRLTSLGLMNYSQVSIVQPLNVNLTSYALTVGQFYEGNFSGQFKDNQNVIHAITCTFRVRRTY